MMKFNKKHIGLLFLVITNLFFTGIVAGNNPEAGVNGTLKKDFKSQGPNPTVQFSVYEPTHQERMEIPSNVDFWKAKQTVDKDGISCFQTDNGQLAYNVSTVAFQAMQSNSSYPEMDINKLIGNKKELAATQKTAFKWFTKHRTVLANGSHIWYYNFPLNYNNIMITSDWPSAFAQAAVIHAYLVAYQITQEKNYLDLAVKAALAYEVSTDKGGLTATVDGLSFYEEVPLAKGYSPHVLNGHLYSTAMLVKLAALCQDERVKQLAENGIKTAKALLPEYDMGYWTRYDLRPRLKDISFMLAAEYSEQNDPTFVQLIQFVSPDGAEQKLVLDKNTGSTKSPNYSYGDGWGELTPTGLSLQQKNAFLGFAFPGKEPLSYVKSPNYLLKVHFTGKTPPKAYILGFREKIKEYYDLTLVNIQEIEGTKVASYAVGIRDLQWSTLQRYYVDWHTRCVHELWALTKDPALRLVSVRWSQYLEDYDHDLKAFADKKDELVLNQRVFPVYQDDGKLAPYAYEALQLLNDEEINRRNLALTLVRYSFFRLGVGQASRSTAADIIADGKGSCSHYSTILEALSRQLGMKARIWNVYDIPVVGGHNLAEVYIQGKWAAVDPAYGVFFTTEPSFEGTLPSVQDLFEAKGQGYYMWVVSEYGKRARGTPFNDNQVKLKDSFELKEKHPLVYDPSVIFSVNQAGTRDENLKYLVLWPIDLATTQENKKYLIGKKDFSGSNDMWSGLVGLKKDNDVIVSLHDIGKTKLHTVNHRYQLTGLTPGVIYRLEIGIAYASQSQLTINMKVQGLPKEKSLVLAPTAEVGYAKKLQNQVLFLQAQENTHLVDLNIPENGYMLLNYIQLEPTELTHIPHPISAEMKVIKSTPFYEGHTPEIAISETPGYAAARENTLPNAFVLDAGKNVIASGLELIWNSEKQYAKKFMLKGIRSNGEVTVLLSVETNKPQTNHSNIFALPHDNLGYRYFQFVVYEATDQDRLLLEKLKIIGSPNDIQNLNAINNSKEDKLPFDPDVLFSTQPDKTKSENLEQLVNWSIDLPTTPENKKYFIGKKDFSGSNDMWNGLVNVKNEKNATVSLHEIGKTKLHTVNQRYQLTGLIPGVYYRLEMGLAYASQEGLSIDMKVKGLPQEKFLVLAPIAEAGAAQKPQNQVLFFQAQENSHLIDLNIPTDGYILLNYIQLEPTHLTNIPQIVSTAMKVVESTAFYEGHTPEFAISETPGYAAARENTLPNSFVLDAGKDVVASGLNLVWNSEKQYAKKFMLKGIRSNGEETVLLNVAANKSQNNHSNVFVLPQDNLGYRYFEFVVYEAAGQDRLLLKNFQIIGSPIAPSFPSNTINNNPTQNEKAQTDPNLKTDSSLEKPPALENVSAFIETVNAPLKVSSFPITNNYISLLSDKIRNKNKDPAQFIVLQDDKTLLLKENKEFYSHLQLLGPEPLPLIKFRDTLSTISVNLHYFVNKVGRVYFELIWCDENNKPINTLEPYSLRLFIKRNRINKDISETFEHIPVPPQARGVKFNFLFPKIFDIAVKDISVSQYKFARKTIASGSKNKQNLQPFKSVGNNEYSFEFSKYNQKENQQFATRGVEFEIPSVKNLFVLTKDHTIASLEKDKILILNKFEIRNFVYQNQNGQYVSTVLTNPDLVIMRYIGPDRVKVTAYDYHMGERFQEVFPKANAKGNFHNPNLGITKILPASKMTLYLAKDVDYIAALTYQPHGALATFIFSEHADVVSYKDHKIVFYGSENEKILPGIGLLGNKIPLSTTVFTFGKHKDVLINNRTYVQIGIKEDPGLENLLFKLTQQGLVEVGSHKASPASNPIKLTNQAFDYLKKFNSCIWIDHAYTGEGEDSLAYLGWDERQPQFYLLPTLGKFHYQYAWKSVDKNINQGLNLIRSGVPANFFHSLPKFNAALSPKGGNLILFSSVQTQLSKIKREQIEQLIRERGVSIVHIYLALGSITPDNFLNESANQALKDLAEFRDKGELHLAKLSDWGNYVSNLDNFRLLPDPKLNTVHIMGNPPQNTMQNVTFVVRSVKETPLKEVSFNGQKTDNFKSREGAYYFWIDLDKNPNKVVKLGF